MKEIKLKWKKYENFFALYEEEKDVQMLIYVIGENRHCYIGCVGGGKGKKGLARRYDKPYIERAKSIFGSTKPRNQPAYVGHFTKGQRISPKVVINVEKIVQKTFEEIKPKAVPAFKRRGTITEMKIKNTDTRPPFLPASCTHNKAAQKGRAKKRRAS
jgi:hypothetical protein